MCRPSVKAIALAAGIATSALALQVPDFSGRWVTEEAAPKPGAPGTTAPPPRGTMGSGWGLAVTISQTATELVVEQPIFSRYDLQPPLKFVYRLDGSESRNTTMAGHATQTRVSRASWEGAILKIVTSYPGIDPDTDKPFTTQVTQRLSLPSPDQLVIETLRAGVLGGKDITTRTVYRKVS